MGDELEEQALRRVVRDDDLAALAADLERGRRAQIEATLGVLAVALQARVLEKLVDLAGPFLLVLRPCRRGRPGERDGQADGAREPPNHTTVHGLMVAENPRRVNAAFLYEGITSTRDNNRSALAVL